MRTMKTTMTKDTALIEPRKARLTRKTRATTKTSTLLVVATALVEVATVATVAIVAMVLVVVVVAVVTAVTTVAAVTAVAVVARAPMVRAAVSPPLAATTAMLERHADATDRAMGRAPLRRMRGVGADGSIVFLVGFGKGWVPLRNVPYCAYCVGVVSVSQGVVLKSAPGVSVVVVRMLCLA